MKSLWFRFWYSATTQTVIAILLDAVEVVALLLALSFVRYFVDGSKMSPEFKELFVTIHEHVFLGMYALLAIKGLVRLVRI